MNKFAKALLLSLFFAAPVAISANAAGAKTVGTHQQQKVAMATPKKHHRAKHTRHAARKSTHAAQSAMKK